MINAAGIALIKNFEGLVDGDPDTPGLDPYLCPAGVATIGWGSTRDLDGYRVTMDTAPITKPEAERLLVREIGNGEDDVLNLIEVPLNENEFAALVSFTYNLGYGNLKSSSLRRLLNQGDSLAAAERFAPWCKARVDGNLVTLPGLVTRRAAERELFLT